MSEQQFTCWDNNQVTETGLPRPYPCCGWTVPPLSFTGTYSCSQTGTPIIGPELNCPTAQPSILTWNLYSDCPFIANSYLYQVTQEFPIYLFVDLNYDCASKDGSDFVGLAVSDILSPFQVLSLTKTCSHPSPATYNINLNGVWFLDYGDGSTITVSINIYQLTYP